MAEEWRDDGSHQFDWDKFSERPHHYHHDLFLSSNAYALRSTPTSRTYIRHQTLVLIHASAGLCLEAALELVVHECYRASHRPGDRCVKPLL